MNPKMPIKTKANGNKFPEFLTASNASKATGLSEHFIRTALKNGDVDYFQIGNRKYVNMDSLYDFVAGGKNKIATGGKK